MMEDILAGLKVNRDHFRFMLGLQRHHGKDVIFHQGGYGHRVMKSFDSMCCGTCGLIFEYIPKSVENLFCLSHKTIAELCCIKKLNNTNAALIYTFNTSILSA